MKSSILLVGNFLSLRGVNRSVGEELADRLLHAGHAVFTTSHRSPRLLRLFDMILATWARRREYQAAYVEVYSGAAFLWAEVVCIVLRFVRKPFILALHGGNLPAFSQRWPGRVRRLLGSASAVTAPSGYLVESLLPNRSDIHLLSNPIDIGKYTFCLRSVPAPRLIWLRAFHTIYNPQMLPLVVEKLIRTNPGTTLMMIGPDKGDGAMQQTQCAIEKFGLQENIEIIPGIPKNRVPVILGQGDIFINSARVDNTPVSLVEAMACGMCIVSTNVGGIPYLVQDGIDGLLVPPGDPEAMSAAVKRILDSPTLAENLSRNARTKAEQFDWSIILPKWEALFQYVIDG